MTKLIYLTEIAHNLRSNLASLDRLGLPAAAGYIDLALNQIDRQCSDLERIESKLAPFGDEAFQILDEMALRLR